PRSGSSRVRIDGRPCRGTPLPVSWGRGTGSLLAVARRDAAGGLLEEEDREAGVPGVFFGLVVAAPGAVVLLRADDGLGAFHVPVVVAELGGVVEHARALQRVHVIEVVAHGEVLADPVDARAGDGVLLEVAAQHVLVEHGGSNGAGGHAVGGGLVFFVGGMLVAPALDLGG